MPRQSKSGRSAKETPADLAGVSWLYNPLEAFLRKVGRVFSFNSQAAAVKLICNAAPNLICLVKLTELLVAETHGVSGSVHIGIKIQRFAPIAESIVI